MSEVLQQKWTEAQLKYIQFVARGKRTRQGEKRTDEQFASAIGVDRVTLWRWRSIEGFNKAVFDEILRENVHYLPDLVKAQMAGGMKKGKGGDTPAATLILKSYQLLLDKVDHTTNGKDMPTPILGGK
jgi:transcriptional regulator with XRE-family HTH domain